MTNEFEGRDRFGCGAIAMAVALTLFILTLIVSVMSGTDWQRTIQNFLDSQQQDQDAGPGGGQGRPIPAVSDRFFSSGRAQAVVSGGISISPSIQIDPVASYAQDGLVWVSFIDVQDPGAGEVLLALNEPENSVTVARGPLHAIGVDDACAFDIQVTGSLLSGHVACTGIAVFNNDTDTGQETSIQLDFSAVTDTSIEPDLETDSLDGG